MAALCSCPSGWLTSPAARWRFGTTDYFSTNRADKVSITVVLDPDEEAYRLGYGDREGLEQIQKLASNNHIGLRAQPGLRIGLLVADGDILVWSPTPAAVENRRIENEPNGLELSAGSHDSQSNSIVDVIRNAVGSDDSDVLFQQAEVGQKAFTPEQVSKTIEVLKQNPPAPFDLRRHRQRQDRRRDVTA